MAAAASIGRFGISAGDEHVVWLIGAILPAKRGSRYEVDQGMRQQVAMDQMIRKPANPTIGDAARFCG